MTTFDPRTEKNIVTLRPSAQAAARLLLEQQNTALAKKGYVAKVTRALATYAEQDALFDQPHDGRDNDGDGKIDEADEKVTNARGGESWHNFGVAWDITIFALKTGKPTYAPELYELAADAALDVPGIERGIDWPGKKKDRPHYQLALGISLATARAIHAQGKFVA